MVVRVKRESEWNERECFCVILAQEKMKGQVPSFSLVKVY